MQRTMFWWLNLLWTHKNSGGEYTSVPQARRVGQTPAVMALGYRTVFYKLCVIWCGGINILMNVSVFMSRLCLVLLNHQETLQGPIYPRVLIMYSVVPVLDRQRLLDRDAF